MNHPKEDTDVKGMDIGKAGSAFTAADIKYTTLATGYNYYLNDNVKLMLRYSIVNNEKTQLAGYTTDLKDNVFTCRLPYRF